MNQRERWSTRFSFILATLGFSVGIGNLWRFPYLTGQYGGGVFLLFYIVVVFVTTIPLFSVEVTLGRSTRRDPVGAYKTLAPGSRWFLNGYLNVLTLILVVGYAMPIVGTILAYVCKTAWGILSNKNPKQVEDYYAAFSGSSWEIMIWTSLSVAILVFILGQGLEKGIERANKVMMPALFVILTVLIVRSLTLPGVVAGLTFYLKPDLSRFSLQGALTAIGQTFFAVGVAMATTLVYGSYLPPDRRTIVKDSAIIVLFSTLIAFMAGLMIFPSVFSFGLDPTAGPGLTFITMSNVFNQMPFGRLFGTLFYVLFFLAALTSFIGAFEGIIAWLRDQYGIPRTRGVWAVGIGSLVMSSFVASSAKFFEIADYVVNNIFLILGALLMAIFAGWVWGFSEFIEAAGIHSRATRLIWAILIRYVIPLVILVLWFSRLKMLPGAG